MKLQGNFLAGAEKTLFLYFLLYRERKPNNSFVSIFSSEENYNKFIFVMKNNSYLDENNKFDISVIFFSGVLTFLKKKGVIKNVKNIVGIKAASGDLSQIAKTVSLAGEKLELYSGNDDQIVPVLSLGGKGVISVLSNVAPDAAHDICEKYFEGDVKGSAELQLKALPLIDQLFCEVNPIPVKKAMQLMGVDCGPLRMPLTEISPEHEKNLAQAMKDFGIQLA